MTVRFCPRALSSSQTQFPIEKLFHSSGRLMNMRRFLPLYTLLVASCAWAAEPLTWDAAVQEAIRQNPELAAAQESVKGAQARYRGNFSNFLPQVSGSASYNHSGTSRKNADESYGASLSASQSLFTGFRDKAQLTQARASWDAASASRDAVSADVGFGLRSAFYGLLYAQEQLSLSQTIAERRKENVRLVELRYQAGREHKGSFLRSRASSSQAAFELAQAGRAVRTAQRELLKLLGRREIESVQVTGRFGTDEPGDPPDLESMALTTPLYRQAAANALSARAGLTVARSRFFPNLSASASTGRSGSDFPLDDDGWSMGLNLSYSFLAGGADYYGSKNARAQDRAAQYQLQDAADQAALNLEDAHAGYQDAVQRTKVQMEFLEAAKVRAEIARSQYTNGLLTFDDWDLIENDLISNQKSALSSQRDAVTAEAAWTRTLGKGIETYEK